MQTLIDNINPQQPFLRWAGGKRWIIPKIQSLIPDIFDNYFEPFLGSGAVYFSIKPDKALLSDSNENLINTYVCIRDNWEKVLFHLKDHQENHCKEYYYNIRSIIYDTACEKAAQFIYLNRTCWNGLYRVNLNGNYNVPIGTKKNVILPTDDFEAISNTLKSAKIEHSDFEVSLNKAKYNDFVFIDPPYTVKHNKNGFIKYNEKLFSWEDQVRLRDSIAKGIERGAMFLITNARHFCIEELYNGLGSIHYLSRNNVLAGNAIHRGKFDEIAIKTW